MIKNLSKICIKNLSRSYKRSDSRQGDPGPLGDEGGRRLISVAVKMLRLVKIIQRILMIGRSPPWFLLAGFSCCFCFLCHFFVFFIIVATMSHFNKSVPQLVRRSRKPLLPGLSGPALLGLPPTGRPRQPRDSGFIFVIFIVSENIAMFTR